MQVNIEKFVSCYSWASIITLWGFLILQMACGIVISRISSKKTIKHMKKNTPS